jgi:hypothetical protein
MLAETKTYFLFPAHRTANLVFINVLTKGVLKLSLFICI